MLFLAAELHIPGLSPCGFIGVALIIVSMVLTVVYVPFGLVIIAGELGGACVFIMALYRYIKRRQLYGKLILDETLGVEPSEIGSPESLIGKTGVTKTALKPVGKADFNGATLEVFADGAYIPENTKVKVVESGKTKIIVKRIPEQ
jgi:membrane-bound serine protease (ClpP class)